MKKWLQLWEDSGGYPFDFISPHSIDTCEQILNDHSRRSYLKNNPVILLNDHKRLYFPFVDVHHLSPAIYEFRMEYQFNRGDKNKKIIEIKGSLERLPDGTHVTGIAKASNEAKISWWVWIFGLLATIVIVNISFFPPITEPFWLLLIYWAQPFFWGWLFWRSVLHPTTQFILSPERWLGSAPSRLKTIISKHRKQPLKATFDVYAPLSMAVGIEQLKKGSVNRHYQHTQAGTVLGTAVKEELFITFEEESPEHGYFLLERSMWLCQPNPYNTSVCLLGSIQAEEDMIHIQGYSYLPNGRIYIRLAMMLVLMSLLSLSVSPYALVVLPIAYVITRGIIHRRLKVFQQYPKQAILRQKSTQNRASWFSLRYDFDFYSPYPLADCVNMLLNYSIVGDYENAEGIHKSAYVQKNYLVTVTKSPEGKFLFSVQNTNGQGGERAESVGKLESVGYSTRVSGTSRVNAQWGWVVFSLSIIIFVIFILPMGGGLSVFFGFFLAVLLLLGFIGVVYVVLKAKVVSAGKYAERTLGSKGGRKGKKDVANADK